MSLLLHSVPGIDDRGCGIPCWNILTIDHRANEMQLTAAAATGEISEMNESPRLDRAAYARYSPAVRRMAGKWAASIRATAAAGGISSSLSIPCSCPGQRRSWSSGPPAWKYMNFFNAFDCRAAANNRLPRNANKWAEPAAEAPVPTEVVLFKLVITTTDSFAFTHTLEYTESRYVSNNSSSRITSNNNKDNHSNESVFGGVSPKFGSRFRYHFRFGESFITQGTVRGKLGADDDRIIVL